MKDFLGKELNVGDKVVCLRPEYKYFVHGEVVKITEKTMQIEITMGSRKETRKRYSDQVVKI